MRSPFPGMDPYLEAHWRDVHGSLITYARDAIQGQLAGDLVARIEERVYVERDDAITRLISPDVHVVEDRKVSAGENVVPTLAVAEPVLLRLEVEPTVERYIRILDTNGNQIVTAIEFLSPANKLPGEGFKAYQRKRSEFIESNSNLVEIDLVRAGDWRHVFLPMIVPVPWHAMYRAVIRRAKDLDGAEYYALPLRKRLPRLAIPLRLIDKDVILDLQSLVDKVYENGRYNRTDYTQPLQPPLDSDDAAWMQTLLGGHKA